MPDDVLSCRPNGASPWVSAAEGSCGCREPDHACCPGSGPVRNYAAGRSRERFGEPVSGVPRPGFGTLRARSASARQALASALPGVEVTVEARSLPGEITAQATETVMNLASEVEPELVVWQVGINDVLAKAEVSPFAEALDEVLTWARSHGMDTLLVEPPYTAAMANDDHFVELITIIRNRARENEVALVRRSAAMRFLSEQKTEAAQSRFGLQNLGYHCTAEHVAHAVVLAVKGAAGSK